MSSEPRHASNWFRSVWADLEWAMIGPHDLTEDERARIREELAGCAADIEETQHVIANLHERDAEIANTDDDDDWYDNVGRFLRVTLAEAAVSLGDRVQEQRQRMAMLEARLRVRRQAE